MKPGNAQNSRIDPEVLVPPIKNGNEVILNLQEGIDPAMRTESSRTHGMVLCKSLPVRRQILDRVIGDTIDTLATMALNATDRVSGRLLIKNNAREQRRLILYLPVSIEFKRYLP